MAKKLFIGDIHGRIDALKKAANLAQELGATLISVGDIFDSYDQSIENQFECFRLLLDLRTEDKAVILPGNHDLAYVFPRIHSCSGNKAITMAKMSETYNGRTYKFWLENLPYWIWIDPYGEMKDPLLVTHAGLTDSCFRSISPYEENLYIKNIPNLILSEEKYYGPDAPIYANIGYARGGNNNTGGIFWCDFNNEFEPIDNLNQVFGHTRAKNSPGIRERKNLNSGTNFCIDCLDLEDNFLLLDENGKFSIVSLD